MERNIGSQIKRKLINASLLLTAYKLLKISLIDDVKSFFGFDEKYICNSKKKGYRKVLNLIEFEKFAIYTPMRS